MENEQLAAQLRQPNGDAGIKVAEAMNASNKQITNKTVETLQLKDDDSVLEIGMGNGSLLADLFAINQNVTYTGVDYSKLMVDQAKKINKSLIDSGKADFHQAEASSLPFDNSSFDKVFCVNVIYFWEQPEVELKEVFRVLKDEGVFAIGIRTKASMINMPFTAYGFKLYTKEDLDSVMLSNGFAVISSDLNVEKLKSPQGEEFNIENLVATYRKNLKQIS